MVTHWAAMMAPETVALSVVLTAAKTAEPKEMLSAPIKVETSVAVWVHWLVDLMAVK